MLKGTTALLRSLAAPVQLFFFSNEPCETRLRAHENTHTHRRGERPLVRAGKRHLIFCHPFVFARLSICISLISSPFLPHSHFIDFKNPSHTLSLSHRDTHRERESARCGLTLPIYPEGGGLIEIYNDYQETEDEYIVGA